MEFYKVGKKVLSQSQRDWLDLENSPFLLREKVYINTDQGKLGIKADRHRKKLIVVLVVKILNSIKREEARQKACKSSSREGRNGARKILCTWYSQEQLHNSIFKISLLSQLLEIYIPLLREHFPETQRKCPRLDIETWPADYHYVTRKNL